jgi:hypothetical protein
MLALEIVASADVSLETTTAFASELRATIEVHEGGRIHMLSAEPPSFISLLGDVESWVGPLQTAAALYLGQLKNLADETWKNRDHLKRTLHTSALAQLHRVASALARLKAGITPRTSVNVGIRIPNNAFGARLALPKADETDIAWRLAGLVHNAEQIRAILDTAVANGHGPLGMVQLHLGPTGELDVTWHDEQLVLHRHTIPYVPPAA